MSSELAALEQRAAGLASDLDAARRRAHAAEQLACAKGAEVEDLRAAYKALATEHRRAQARARTHTRLAHAWGGGRRGRSTRRASQAIEARAPRSRAASRSLAA